MKHNVVVGFALALVLLSAAAAGAEPGVQVKLAFGPLIPEKGALVVDVAPRADGSLLAASGNAVFALDPDGHAAPLGHGERAVLDPAGYAFGLWQHDAFQVFDAHGERLGELPAPLLSSFKFAPGGKLVYAPRVTVRREFGVVESVRLVRPDGSKVADFPAAALQISRLLDDRIVYTLPDALVARTFEGQELWSTKLPVHKFETAGDRAIVVRRYVPGEVLHLDRGQRVSAAKVEGVVWNLAISPHGHVSAATTQTQLYVFRDGQPTATLRLPLAYANTLDISDRGETLVGGQGAKGEAMVLLYDAKGTLLWRGAAGTDRAAYRPGVRFAPGGERFIVIEPRGVSAYDVVRSQP